MSCKIHYYHIEITGQKYRISESCTMQKASALDTLRNIQRIFTEKLQPAETCKNWTPQGHANYLNSIAAVILDQYTSAVHKRLWYVLSFMSVLFDKIISPLRNLRESIQIEATAVDSARKLGYRGNDTIEAQTYIEELYREIDSALFIGLIPNTYRARTWQSCLWDGFATDNEKTVQNLKRITTNDLFSYLSYNGTVAFDRCQKVARLFSVKGFCSPTQSPVVDSSSGSRALLKAIEKDTTALAELLLDAGADPSVYDDSGNNALHWAAQRGNSTLVERLVPTMRDSMNQSNRFGATPLVLAWNSSRGPNKEVLKLLLDHGAGTAEQQEVVRAFLSA